MRLLLLLPLLAAGAAAAKAPPILISAQGWRAAATGVDRIRIRDWRKTFVKALADARAHGHGAAITAQGPLLEPDSALANVAPPAGSYRCRTIKLGVRGARQGDYIVDPVETCRIAPGEGGIVTFARLTGPQRAFGRLFPDAERRVIFLGTYQFGDEKGVIPYGADEMRGMAGLVQRVGERRWRLVLPAPHFESSMDVVELLPG